MNYKQKLGYMAIGAGILAVGIIIGQIITPDIEAQSNGVFDKIQCRELEVVDKHNETAIRLSGNNILIYDKHGNLEISLGAKSISIFNERKSAIFLSAGRMQNSIWINDETGKTAIELIAYKILGGHNRITILDKKGNVEWIAPQ